MQNFHVLLIDGPHVFFIESVLLPVCFFFLFFCLPYSELEGRITLFQRPLPNILSIQQVGALQLISALKSLVELFALLFLQAQTILLLQI